MKKRIMFVMPALFLGGAETQFRNIISSFAKENYDITVLTLDPLNEESEFIKENKNVKFRYSGVNLNYYKNKYKGKKVRKLVVYLSLYFKLIKKIRKLSKEAKYDVIIGYHMFWSILIPVFKMIGSKVIFSERTAQKILLHRSYLSYFYNKADIITCNSIYTKELLTQINVKDVKVIYNGVKFTNAEEDAVVPKELKKICLIARISPDKNQMLVVDAFKNIEDKELYLIGKIDNKEYYNKLIKKIDEYNLKNKIHFVEYTENIKEIYKMADLIVLPSLEEGMANVILESFLYKKYCIASNIPNNKFLLQNGRGEVFAIDKPDEVLDAIKKYEDMSRDKKRSILDSNYRYLAENFQMSRMTGEYIELVEKLIKETR